ncbi:MAG: NADH-quinone oxidoreductase subunit NuoF [Myxococcota bacterium]|jgi:NADH:ubiquinone oxidoreductase subunit F (NADH-binding)/NAD-dependent dihydropyrimidine dehydrogenase PreA subunit|nr:NADH-quinone oxidoreductase subunit NuoF [Myxococcota bacterium]
MSSIAIEASHQDLLRQLLSQPFETARKHEMMQQWRREQTLRPTLYLGAGTCGLGAGAARTLEAVQAYLKTHGIEAELLSVGCIGLCVEEPLLDVALPGRTRLSFRKVTEDRVPEVLDGVFDAGPMAPEAFCQFRQENATPWEAVPFIDEHPFFAPQTRWVLANCGHIDPSRIEEYIARGGYFSLVKALATMDSATVCDTIEKSGLRGRGGGGFPTGRKWKLALATPSDEKYMICNADEGDPGAFMDRAVIEGDPHRLLEGLALAAYAIGAQHAYVYIRAEYPLAITRLYEAIEQAHALGLLGENIMGSGWNLEIKVKKGAGAFVCGEETALMHSIEGKRGMPRPRPPFPSTSGLFGKPTAINNVETLANVPAIVLNGADWFSSLGTASSKGTKVFALSGKVSRTGLVEVAMGTPLRDIIFAIGGGIPDGRKYKAVQIGGPSGGCIPEAELDIDIDYESLKRAGAMMGSGGLVVMDDKNCMVDVAKYFMGFIQRESCGKCIPCREGTLRLLQILERISSGRQSEHGNDALDRFRGVMYLNRLASVIQDTSLCGLGQTAPNPVLSTLRHFRHEYEDHIYNRHCEAGVCTELLEYSIITDKCVGCTLCAKQCPTGAIIGSPRSPHYVVNEKCIRCGSCVTACRYDAVVAQ